MLFYVTPGVGADKMLVKEGRLCKVNSSIKAAKIDQTIAVPPDSDNTNTILYTTQPPRFPKLYVGKGIPPVSPLSLLMGALDGGNKTTLKGAPTPSAATAPTGGRRK